MAAEYLSTVLAAASAVPPASPYDLTDLATVHDELGIPANDPSNDPFLQRAITGASAAIAQFCNRVFPVEAIQDQIFLQRDPYPYQVPGGVNPLQLSRWPMVASAVVAFTGSTHGNLIVDQIANTARLNVGALVFASDGSLPPGTKIATVGLNSVTLSAPASSSTAALHFTTGVQVIQTLSVGATQTLLYGLDYTLNDDLGWLIRLNPWTGTAELWEAQPVQVQYQAGFTAIPAELIDATLRLVTARFRARGRDPMLVEQTQGVNLGTQRYWVGVTPGQQGAFAPEIASLITQYRTPVVG